MKLKSLVKVEIDSLNQEKIFNKFIEKNIHIFELKRQSHTQSSFKILPNNLSSATKILEENTAKILKSNILGLFKLKNIFFRRIGVFIGLVLTLFFIFFANFYVINFKYCGLETLTYASVSEFLNSQNISKFTPKNNINTSQIELKLIENFECISMASVAIKGSTLVISIKEKETSGNLSETPQKLLADFNGRVKEMTLISGKALVKVGDIVKIGDVLVESVQNSMGLFLEAKAKIVAEVWSEFRHTHFEKTYTFEPTGRVLNYKKISFLGAKVYENNAKNTFSEFREELSEVKLKNTILPVTICQKKYIELKKIEKISPFESEKESIIAFCRENALQNLKSNDIINDEKFAIQSGENGQTNICYVVTATREISQE